MASADNSSEIQRLYDIATSFDSDLTKITTEPAKYEAMYEEILAGSKGAQKTKMLSAQFIPKYLKHFPKFTDKSINCLIDLCEDDDGPTRVYAIRAFPIIAKISPDSVPKLADILGQLLQAELPVELDNVKQALVSLLQQDIKGTLTALFNQSLSEDEDLRVKAIAFIFEKVLPMRDEINKNEDVQRSVAENIKKVLPHVVSAKEFNLFTDLLTNLKIFAGQGQATNELLDLLADINADFNATEDSNIARLSTCLQSATEFLKRGASSAKFTECLGTKVLPAFEKMTEQHQVELIQHLTDTTAFMQASDAKTLLPPLYTLVLSQLPLPAAAGAEQQEPKINFSIAESALYVFHVLAAKSPATIRGLCGINIGFTGQPSSMSAELPVDKKQDLDARLKYVVERTKKYTQQMEAARKTLQKATSPEDLQKKNIIEIALKATQNVLQLAQNLLQKQPVFSGPMGKIILSFKLNKKQQAKSVATKSTTTKTEEKPAPKPKPTTTTTTTATTATASSGARPNFEKVYVPPSRQPGGAKKRTAAAVVDADNNHDNNGQPQPESQKKFKGRGTSKFQNL